MEVFYVAIKTEGLGADGKIKVDYQYVAGPYDRSSAFSLKNKLNHDQKYDPYIPANKRVSYVVVCEVKSVFE
jgi:hypothetical protein